MSPADSGKPPGPIPARELIQRLIERDASGKAKIHPPKRREPFPPVIPSFDTVTTGRFEAHGPGSPPQDSGRTSYFVRILTTQGSLTFWGADLKRALEESETQPALHSLIGIQPIGYQILKTPDNRSLRRNRWRVEAVEFFATRARENRRARESKFRDRNTAAARPPVSSSTPAAVPETPTTVFQLAEAFADRYMHNLHDRKRFLESIQQRLSSPPQVPPRVPDRTKDRDSPTR